MLALWDAAGNALLGLLIFAGLPFICLLVFFTLQAGFQRLLRYLILTPWRLNVRHCNHRR